MKLYTSLTRLKQSLNGGELPVMTPLTDRARALLDPAFLVDPVIGGMGALYEDEERGLRCPVRGCGEFFHFLGIHVASKHGDIGVRLLREVLDMHPKTPLQSARCNAATAYRAHTRARKMPTPQTIAALNASRGRGQWRPRRPRTTGELNMYANCEAQLLDKLQKLSLKLGKTPSAQDWRKAYPQADNQINRVYGSWNGMIRAAGFEPYPRMITREEALQSLREWVQVHGELPSRDQVGAPAAERFPSIPSYNTLQTIFGRGWCVAMHVVARELDLQRSRYFQSATA